MDTDPLVGRHAELERIDTAIRFRDRLPAGILLHGREGVGKTVLWREAVRRSLDAGYRVLECALSRAESRLTFAGLADLIGPALDEVRPELAPPQAHALETALAITPGDASPPDERAVAFGLQGALSVLAGRSPIALAVDDIQWLDPSSTLMLSYAIRRLRREPVLLLFAQRDGEGVDPDASLADGTGVELETIAVGPLPLGAIHRMIRTRLGSSLTRPQLLRIHDASGGNPLHALELARANETEGAHGQDPLATLLANRVAALPEATHLALALAAIASESDLDVLAATYGPHLRQHLQPAIDADLVGVAAGRVRFSHPLVAVAAETSVSDARRRELHLRLASATTSQEVRAAHLAQATAAPDVDVAATLEEAAGASGRRGARAAGAELFEAAARLTPGSEGLDRGRRRLAAAEDWYAAGDARHAREILSALLVELPGGDLRGEAGWRLGVLLDEAGQWPEATDLWREVLLETVAPGLRSRLMCSLAITALYTESVEQAIELAAAAVTSAEESPDPAHLARALAVQALTMSVSGAGGQGAVLERAMRLEAGLNVFLGEWSPSGAAAECARHTGDVDGARHHYAAVLGRAIDAGDANAEQWASFGLGQTELLAGNYRRAAGFADSVLDIADQTGLMRIPAQTLRAHVDAHLGELDAARSLITEAIAGATAAVEAAHLFSSHVVLGTIEACAGDHMAASRAYAEARRRSAEVGLRHATALRALLNEVDAAATAGAPDQAETALAAFETIVAGHPPPWSASMAHLARASLLVAQGDLRSAKNELLKAPDDERVLPLDRGRVLLALGTVSRRLREFSRARETLGRALGIFTDLGTPPWVERAERELRRIPGRRSSEHRGLTDAEERIAELVAVGRSNRDVATALFVSVKTVEVTLTRIYQKVGVHSRAELAYRWEQPRDSSDR